MKTVRLDNYLVSSKLVESRNKAQELIKSNFVLVDEKIINKPNYQLSDQSKIRIIKQEIYVSRAANKLKHALDSFNINLKNKIVLDIGSSTGGFTQVSLLNGASKVYAIDVGTNQMNLKLKTNTRVDLYENTDFRNINLSLFNQKIDFICCDVSFISLSKIIDKLVDLIPYHYEGVFLIKPQYEIENIKIKNFKGIIREESTRKRIIEKLKQYFIKNKFEIINLIESPIRGKEGNIEYLIYVKK